MTRNLPLFFPAALVSFLMGGSVDAAPVELGKVKWGRDYEVALAASVESRRPVLILFQEVPG
ncbi:hypothetical protein N9B73_06275 [Verrucomicrobiales bacterium]|nr:hypothetical protein [Verrucomicrobiales bacterium]